ncbi:MAG: nucleotidyl transferase AbiEii/AbiGii toxin family protein [bacterium]
MRTDILNQGQTSALALLRECPEIDKFYLAGGTALALHLGHRYSRDFDFFTGEQFDEGMLLQNLQNLGQCQDIRKTRQTLFLKFEAILCSFILYKYPLIDFPAVTPWGFSIVSMREIGAMKIMAIGDRGRRRDFVDLYFIMRDLGIEKIWQDFETKYAGTGYDSYHFLRALTYFDDAEGDPMLEMIDEIEWMEVKKHLENEVRKIIL